MTTVGVSRILLVLPIPILLLVAGARIADRAELTPSVLGELSSMAPQYHRVPGGYEVTSPGNVEKWLTHHIAIQPNQTYVVAFTVDQITAPLELNTDLIGPKYDNPEQKFHLKLTPGQAPVAVSQRINSGPAPSEAYLRLFYYDRASIRVTDIRVVPYPASLGFVSLLCKGLAALLTLLFVCLAAIRCKQRAVPLLKGARVASEQHPVAVSILLAFVISNGLYLRQFISSRPFVMSDETHYALQAKYADRIAASAANPMVASPLPNTLYLHLYRYAFAFGDNYLQVARLFNGFFFSLALFPIYAVARKVASAPLALATAVASVVGPVSIYTLFFMPEALYFSGFWVFVWCLFEWLDSHPLRMALCGGLALGALSLVKPHALQLLPISAIAFLLMSVSERRLWPWRRSAVQILLLFVGVALSRLILNLLLTGNADVLSIGPEYSRYASQAAHVPGGWGALMLQHLSAVSILYALPVAAVLTGLLPGALTGLSDDDKRRRRFLLILTALILGILTTTVSRFTIAIAGHGIFEKSDRLHGRYYDFVFPLLLICFLAVRPLFETWQPARRWIFAAVCCVASVAGVSAALRLDPNGSTGFPDFPDIIWLLLCQPIRPYMIALVIVAVTASYLWRRHQSAALFLAVMFAVALLGSAAMSAFLSHNSGYSAGDQAGQVFHDLIAPEERDDGMVVATDNSVDLYRMLFFLSSASGYAIQDKGIPLHPENIPPDRTWVIACGTSLVDVPVLRTVRSGSCELDFLKPSSTDARAAAEPAPPVRPAGRVYQFQAGLFGKTAAEGFYPPESWGIWSKAATPVLRLMEPAKGKVKLVLMARVLKAGHNNHLSVTLGGQTQTVDLSATLQDYTLQFDLKAKADAITFTGIQPESPASVGMGDDTRPLGFALIRLLVEPE